MPRESSPGLAATDAYERAVADYDNCILDHTANLSACEKQRAIMNANTKLGLSFLRARVIKLSMWNVSFGKNPKAPAVKREAKEDWRH